MKKIISKTLHKLGLIKKSQIPQGDDGIKQVGHRKYVGGLWDEIGELQFKFLKKEGLQPNNIFLDIACGSLRAGVHLIPYLDKGNYLGIDKEETLIELGLKHELPANIINIKSPEFVVDQNFDFCKFSKIPDYAIAQSLFTHLPPEIINLCFKNLRAHFNPEGVFYTTYFLSDIKTKNPRLPHDHKNFKYTMKEIKEFGSNNGWDCKFIGDWNHPRNQQIVQYRPV